jgi:hypothetical protein
MPFLRRRPHAPAYTGLRLGGERTVVPDVPRVHGDVTLTVEEPVARLTRLQSGVGSLVISGFESYTVEPVTRDIMPVHANRPLVEQTGDGLIVGLRHVRELRRLIVFAPAGGVVQALTAGGYVVAVPTGVMYLSVIDGEVEIRAESRRL